MSFEDSVTFVLEKITQGPMTSRDIEVMFGKSREHVSRLMKKLFDDGFVGRDDSVRPYRYTITDIRVESELVLVKAMLFTQSHNNV